MKYDTQFDKGATVYFLNLKNTSINKGIVTGINIVDSDNVTITYYINVGSEDSPNIITKTEDILFSNPKYILEKLSCTIIE